ncbi:MAG: hypothetical protein RIC15_09680 [Vicingaceae bacterium]
MVGSILLFLSILFQGGDKEHKIEIYVFNERCIPVTSLMGPMSFQRKWYSLAKTYKPEGVPILTKHDIVSFDTKEFQLLISDHGWETLKKEGIPTSGIPVLLVIDDVVSYGAWLWTPLSSSVCDGVAFVFFEGAEEKVLKIRQPMDEQNEIRIPRPLTSD